MLFVAVFRLGQEWSQVFLMPGTMHGNVNLYLSLSARSLPIYHRDVCILAVIILK